MPTITAPDGTKLACVDAGVGPPVVLLHGLSGSAHVNWVDNGAVALLASRGYRAIALDARGHGRSGTPEDGAAYTTEVVAGDVVHLVESLDLGPVHLVGYSWGCRIAAYVTTATVTDVRSLVLGGSTPSGLAPLEPGPDVERVLAMAEGDDPPAGITEHGARPRAVAAIYRAQQYAPMIDLSRVRVPTLVLNSPEEGFEVADAIEDAARVLVPGGHLTVIDEPAFAVAIADFLDGVRAS